MYVVRLDAEKNQVVIGPKEALYSARLQADRASWVAGEPPAPEFTCEIKIRNLHTPAKATVRILDGDAFEAEFDEPQLSVTAGQSACTTTGHVLGGE
jgi:tRNA-specific 2-thiouridylase